MAYAPYSYERFREGTNLFIPGKKPIGPIMPEIRDLRAAYLFRGSARDITGNGNNGSISTGNTYVVTEGDQAIDCRGGSNDDVIAIPTIAQMRGSGTYGDFTWVFRVKAESIPSGARGGIWQQGSSFSDSHNLYVEDSPRQLRFSIKHYINFYAYADFPSGWAWIAARYDTVSDTLSVFVDGIKGTDATNATPSTVQTDPLLGAVFYPAYDRQWDGQISAAMFFDRALSDAEIVSIHADPYAGFMAA